jgi:hypothetical protein
MHKSRLLQSPYPVKLSHIRLKWQPCEYQSHLLVGLGTFLKSLWQKLVSIMHGLQTYILSRVQVFSCSLIQLNTMNAVHLKKALSCLLQMCLICQQHTIKLCSQTSLLMKTTAWDYVSPWS